MVRGVVQLTLPLLALSLAAVSGSSTAQPGRSAAPVERRIEAPEARQGVASDGIHVFAVDNNVIAKYRKSDGRKLGEWRGDPELFPHINSCTMADGELVCAASNHSDVPQLSTIEFFDPESLQHVRSVSLGMAPGSLTVVDRHEGHWWAVFANYDGNGGDPSRDHRYTLFAQLDEEFRIARGWAFPEEVLACLKPMSASGASWGPGGLLYTSGHDRPEIHVLDLPGAGSTLRHVDTIPVATHGQAIDFDPEDDTLLWSLDRKSRTIVASRIAAPNDKSAAAGSGSDSCASARPEG
jgi:hypothetical protein